MGKISFINQVFKILSNVLAHHSFKLYSLHGINLLLNYPIFNGQTWNYNWIQIISKSQGLLRFLSQGPDFSIQNFTYIINWMYARYINLSTGCNLTHQVSSIFICLVSKWHFHLSRLSCKFGKVIQGFQLVLSSHKCTQAMPT